MAASNNGGYIIGKLRAYVNWISVRFLLILAELLHLDTQAINYVLAFPQADLEVPVYMELPTGMELQGQGNGSPGFILSLNFLLYGLKTRRIIGITCSRMLCLKEDLWSLYQTHVYSSVNIW